MSKQIILDFDSIALEADLFDSPVAERIAETLPLTINLEQWGNELYGSIGMDLGENAPVAEIPPGGLAYTNNGNYVCIFYGQTPAWPVEYIGHIKGDSWKKLMTNTLFNTVTLRFKK